jgi:hypothetical protein
MKKEENYFEKAAAEYLKTGIIPEQEKYKASILLIAEKMKNKEVKKKIDALKYYEYSYELPEAEKKETTLHNGISVLETYELKQLLDEAKNNSGLFVWKLSEALEWRYEEALEAKNFSAIRHNAGNEMTEEMNDEVFAGVKEVYEKQKEKRRMR